MKNTVMITPLIPDWPIPENVFACSTTRAGGVSAPPYHSLNMADHVGDRPQAVATNRQRLLEWVQCNAPFTTTTPVRWLEQVHGTRVITLEKTTVDDRRADAAYTRQAGSVCIVMTADCLPVLFCSRNGDEVAAAHAGWRGLCAGILENTVACFQAKKRDILAWLGPAIGPLCFEVGREVKAQFMRQYPEAEQAFIAKQGADEKYLADLYLLARQRLIAMGIKQIFDGNYCTFSEPQRFFSYRRESVTGRMATLIAFREKQT